MPTVRTIRIAKIVVPGIAVLIFVGYFLVKPRRAKGCFVGREKITIAAVSYGPFFQYIPQTGRVESDSISGTNRIWVNIDELYLPQIAAGLTATTTFNNTDYGLTIEEVMPTVVDGRFTVRMGFNNTAPIATLPPTLRLRIQLGDTSNQILLPVGGFYKDTGGKWIFVMQGDDKAVKRNVVLGRKMGSEYFEVLEGLLPGERVITSSYENFPAQDILDADDLKQKNKRKWFDRLASW